MSRGKYSPRTPHAYDRDYQYKYNAKGAVPPEWDPESGVKYNEELHFDNYDDEGYDMYGYSAYNADGEFVGMGNGVDRLGNTEMEYLTEFTDEEFGEL